MRLYAKLALGRQQHTSWIKKEFLDGTASWQQTFAFAVPLPLRDRQLRLELYRTSSSSQKGRLISTTHVWLRDLLPAGLAADVDSMQRVSVELESMVKGMPGGRVQLKCAVVDTDVRREMYQAPFVEAGRDGEETREAREQATAAGEGHGTRRLRHMQSVTEEWSKYELRKKAKHTEESFSAWRASRHSHAEEAVAGLLPAVSGMARRLAHSSWRHLSQLIWSPEEAGGTPGSSPSGSETSAAFQPPPPPPPPRPAGTLLLNIDSLTLASAGSSDCVVVFKCGPFWGRSRVLSSQGGNTFSCAWQLALPILDPSTILTLAVCQQPSRTQCSTAVLRPGLIVKDAVRDAFSSPAGVAGKLRVRLSCLRPNAELCRELPLLGERSKGGNVVGSVRMLMEARFEGTVSTPCPPFMFMATLSWLA